MSMSVHFSSPRDNVLQMGLREGMRVGDFGTGTGHYAQAAADIVGDEGRVYAVDIHQDILDHMVRSAERRYIGCIRPTWGDIDKVGGTHLHDASLDAVMLANVLFQISDRDALAQEIRRVLVPGGKLLVVDWSGSYGGIGPASRNVVPAPAAEAFFIEQGFHKVKSFRAGPHHYGILFTV